MPGARARCHAAADFRLAAATGQVGVIVSLSGRVVAVIGLDTDGQRVQGIRAVGHPQKLAYLTA